MVSRIRSRLAAAVSISALAAAGVVVAAAPAVASPPPGTGVNFTFQPGTAPLVTHYVVTPSGSSHNESSTSNEDSRTITLSPKGDPTRSRKHSQSGVSSDNTIQETGRSDDNGNPSRNASFIGQQGSATTCSYFGPGCNPPDMALGASSNFVLQGVNTQWEVLDTKGNVQPGWPVSAQSFFGIPNMTAADGVTPCDTAHGSQPFLSDPRALYDPIGGRFWAAMLQVSNGLGLAMAGCDFKSVYYISVSQTSDPNGKWNVYEFDMANGQDFAADYTQLGINGQAVYFSANMFGNVSGFYSEIFEANKSKMEHGQGGFTADGFTHLQGTGPGTNSSTGPFLADTVQPTINLDGSTGSTETFVDTVDGPDLLTGNFCGFTGLGFSDSCSGMVVWQMSNPTGHDHGGPAPTLSARYEATNPFLVSPPADQPTCTQCIDALDLRITGTPVVRDGVVYATWDTAIDNGTQTVPGIEWAQVKLNKLSSGKAAQTDYYNFSGDGAATFGTVMPDGEGNVAMLFEHMSNSVMPEARYIVKRANHSNFEGPGTLLKAGESSYRPSLCGSLQSDGSTFVCRWGDFEAASFDGSGHIWFAGEYANAFQAGPPANGRNWGTWIGSIRAS